ncbi:MAG: hypothetical protein PHH85_01715 [Candidatus Methanoperedens sp.]|nr:hypothetical protein [Candidatus Methanoperedens sp.]
MVKIQLGNDGRFNVTIPKDIVDGKAWKKGDELGFCIVDHEINRPVPGDIFLRKNR